MLTAVRSAISQNERAVIGGCRCVQRRQQTKSMIITNIDPVAKNEIPSFLRSNQIPFRKGYTCFSITCPRSSAANDTKMSSSSAENESEQLYVNTTSGYFMCKRCRNSGSWSQLKHNMTKWKLCHSASSKLKSCFGEDLVKKLADSDRISDFLSSCSAAPLGNRDQELLRSIGLKRINWRTIAEYGGKVLPNKDGLIFPVLAEEMPEFFKSAKVMQVDEEGSLKASSFLPNTSLLYDGLFGFHLVRNQNQKLIFTETEGDAMAVYQATRQPAVCLPKGCSTLPQEALPFLERFSDIIIWFNNDMQTFDHAKHFAKKLGHSRTRLVRPFPENLAPLKALQSGADLRKILKSAVSIEHYHIVSFNQHRQEVLNELMFSEQVAGVKWSGYPKLNEILKGHRRGELTVFTGGTGTGKTTFISDYSLDLCRNGVHTLWGSFEIPNVRLMKMMLQQFARKSLSKHIDEFDYYADEFEQLKMFFMNFHGKENIDKVIETMSHAVYVFDIVHVIVDNLQFMMGSDKSMNDRIFHQDVIIGAFRRFATNMNCHVTLVVHPRKEDDEELSTSSIFGGAKAAQEADNIMILQRTGSGVHTRKYLQVTKNRFDGHLGAINLHFDKSCQSFSTKNDHDPTAQHADDHLSSCDETSANDDLAEDDHFESQW